MKKCVERMDRVPESIYASPWGVVGAAIILALVVVVLAMINIRRAESAMSEMLREKGAALIRSFEAGTRTGILGRFGQGVRIQTLVEETAEQPDILYIAVTDRNGRVLVHSDRALVGAQFLEPEQVRELQPEPTAKWRIMKDPDGEKAFVVYATFLPVRGKPGPPMVRGQGRGAMQGDKGGKGRRGEHSAENNGFFCFEPLSPGGELQSLSAMDLIIFVGMDVAPFEMSRGADVRNTIMISAILIVLGFGGVVSLFWAEKARASRKLLMDTRATASEVVANLPVGLVVTDREGRTAFFNSTAEEMSGIPSTGAMGREPGEYLPVPILNASAPVRSGEVVPETELECVFPNAGSAPVSLSVSASPIRTEDNEHVGDVYVFRDLSEVKSLQAEIRRKEKLAAVGSLAAGVAHEIRNPLSSIKGYATFFGTKFEPGSEESESAKVMVAEVDRLNKTITELLDLARPLEAKPRPVDVSELIERSLRLISPDAQASGVEARFDNPGDLPDVDLDADRIVQALLNLELNAVQAMCDGGTLTVTAGLDPMDRFLITVADTGPGIEHGDVGKVFDPYFTTKPQGTGLGLAIVHKIMEAHGGEVVIISEPGSGSAFTLRFPAHAVQSPSDGDIS